jgi:hypothetical protein
LAEHDGAARRRENPAVAGRGEQCVAAYGGGDVELSVADSPDAPGQV